MTDTDSNNSYDMTRYFLIKKKIQMNKKYIKHYPPRSSMSEVN